jgi:hypothetical protein
MFASQLLWHALILLEQLLAPKFEVSQQDLSPCVVIFWVNWELVGRIYCSITPFNMYNEAHWTVKIIR